MGNLIILRLHRDAVAACNNFQEFQEIQLDLLDYMLESMADPDEKAADNYISKQEERLGK
jgi:hypothetical protein